MMIRMFLKKAEGEELLAGQVPVAFQWANGC